MSTFQVLSLLIAFGMLVAFIMSDRHKVKLHSAGIPFLPPHGMLVEQNQEIYGLFIPTFTFGIFLRLEVGDYSPLMRDK